MRNLVLFSVANDPHSARVGFIRFEALLRSDLFTVTEATLMISIFFTSGLGFDHLGN